MLGLEWSKLLMDSGYWVQPEENCQGNRMLKTVF